MRYFVFLICFPVVLMLSCNREDPAQARSQIESGHAKLTHWYATGQADSIAGMFTADARQFGPNSPPVVGRESIRRGWANAARLGIWTFTFTTKEVAVSGSLAGERGTYILSFTPGPGAPQHLAPRSDRCNYLTQWRLDNGKWRIVNDLTTSELPKFKQ